MDAHCFDRGSLRGAFGFFAELPQHKGFTQNACRESDGRFVVSSVIVTTYVVRSLPESFPWEVPTNALSRSGATLAAKLSRSPCLQCSLG